MLAAASPLSHVLLLRPTKMVFFLYRLSNLRRDYRNPSTASLPHRVRSVRSTIGVFDPGYPWSLDRHPSRAASPLSPCALSLRPTTAPSDYHYPWRQDGLLRQAAASPPYHVPALH